MGGGGDFPLVTTLVLQMNEGLSLDYKIYCVPLPFTMPLLLVLTCSGATVVLNKANLHFYSIQVFLLLTLVHV